MDPYDVHVEDKDISDPAKRISSGYSSRISGLSPNHTRQKKTHGCP